MISPDRDLINELNQYYFNDFYIEDIGYDLTGLKNVSTIICEYIFEDGDKDNGASTNDTITYWRVNGYKQGRSAKLYYNKITNNTGKTGKVYVEFKDYYYQNALNKINWDLSTKPYRYEWEEEEEEEDDDGYTYIRTVTYYSYTYDFTGSSVDAKLVINSEPKYKYIDHPGYYKHHRVGFFRWDEWIDPWTEKVVDGHRGPHSEWDVNGFESFYVGELEAGAWMEWYLCGSGGLPNPNDYLKINIIFDEDEIEKPETGEATVINEVSELPQEGILYVNANILNIDVSDNIYVNILSPTDVSITANILEPASVKIRANILSVNTIGDAVK